MSIVQLCDICKKATGQWEFRKRYRIFKQHIYLESNWKDEIDMCDLCLVKFKEFINAPQGKV